MKTAFRILAVILLAAGGAFLWHFSGGQRTIRELIKENTQLRDAITNLSAEQQIGYAKVLEQPMRDGTVYTRVVFVQTSASDPAEEVLRKEFEIEGDIAHFDGLIVRFGNEVVMDGKERAICLWRRVYGEKMRPEEGYAIDVGGSEPAQYEPLCRALSIRDRGLFWEEIWALSNDPRRLEDLGISAVYGNVVYRKLRPGLIYIFKLTSTGTLYPEVIPDL